MKLLNIASKAFQGNFADLISRNNEVERIESPISKAIMRKKEQLPLFDYLFIVNMPDLVIGPNTEIGLQSWINYSELEFDVRGEIDHRVFTIASPNYTYDTKKTQTKNTYFYSISNKDIGQLSLTMDEFEDALTLKYINAWRKLMENDDGTYNAPSVYKREIKLVRYSGSKNELDTITYVGCFPVGMSESTYTHVGSSIVQYNVSFACDSVVYGGLSVNGKRAMAEVQNEIIKKLPAEKSGSGLNVASAINILGRIQNLNI